MANFLDNAAIFEGKYPKDIINIKEIKTITEKDFNEFRELLSISDSFTEGLNMTDSCIEYFKTFELLSKIVDNELKEDLFYASKLGFFYEGIPCRIVYLLKKAIRKYNTPNNAISSIDLRAMDKYLKKGSLPNGITLKQIMENVIGREFDLITKYRRFAKYRDVIEVYVENTDRILVLPEDLAVFVESQDDLLSVEYIKGIGVCVQNIPIRIMGGRMGITLNEYDLRECK